MSYNKKMKLIIFLILMIIPVRAFGLELNCGDAIIDPKDSNKNSVTCNIDGDVEGLDLSSITFNHSENLNLNHQDSELQFIVTAKDNAAAGTYQIEMEAENELTASTNIIVTYSTLNYITILDANDNQLTKIACENGVTTYDYEIVDNDDSIDIIKIGVERTDYNNATISGQQLGEKPIIYGLNTFEITVTSRAGTTTTYTLNIKRLDNRSSENELITFYFNDYDFNFSSSVYEYYIDLDNNINKIAICPSEYENDNVLCIDYEKIRYSDKATIGLIYNLNDVDLPTTLDSIQEIGNIGVGNNILKIRVTAENGSDRDYIFNINRKDADGNTIDKTDKEASESPGTGDAAITVVIILLVTSLGVIIYIYRDKLFAKLRKK